MCGKKSHRTTVVAIEFHWSTKMVAKIVVMNNNSKMISLTHGIPHNVYKIMR